VTAAQTAAVRHTQQVALARQVSTDMQTAWASLNPANLDRSWLSIIDRLLALLTGGQLLAAQTADPYVAETLAEQGISPAAVGTVAADQLAGIASDGRDLVSLLYQPIIETKTAIGRGGSTDDALAVGQVLLDLIARTQIADAGRVASGIAVVTRPAAEGYTRMVVGRTCSRCIVLAGKWFEWSAGFARHPRCDCVHIPSRENIRGDLLTDPRKVFDSMTAAEQDKAFTAAGAQAIREGADIGQVVNARSGMSSAGVTETGVNADGEVVNLRRRTLTGDTTKTSTTRRGQTPGRSRLMPEAIYELANGDRGEAIRLLRLHRYIQ
jgi:hypothetical protein